MNTGKATGRALERRPAALPPALLAGAVLAPVLLALVSCATIGLSVSRPEGFAEEASPREYRAISPEGLMYRVRTVENYPPKDLAFWSEALRNHLSREGYHMIGQGERFTDTRQQEGMLYEWGVRYGPEDHIYLTAILVFGDRIAVAEAGGEHVTYRKYRDRLLESLKSIRLGS